MNTKMNTKTLAPLLIILTAALIVVGILATRDFGSFAGAQTSCVIPPTGLVNWWPFDEAGGTTAADIVGGQTATLVNGPTFTAGNVANAMNLDGLNDFAVLSSTALDEAAEFTYDAWIKPDSVSGSRMIFLLDEDTSAGIGSFVRMNDGKLEGVIAWSAAFGDGVYRQMNVQTTNAVILAGQWSHIAFVWKAQTGTSSDFKLYVNGVEQPATVTYNDNFNANVRIQSVKVYHGTDGRGIGDPAAYLYDGLLDEVEVFNRALSASEIQAIFAAGSAGKCKVAAVCGNGVVEANGGEQCDDNNTLNNDGCGTFCKVEYCGDGIVQSNIGVRDSSGATKPNTTGLNEQCDGNAGCTNNCQINECTDGMDNDGDGKIDSDDPGCLNESEEGAAPLPDCTVTQMLDVNGDGQVNILDAIGGTLRYTVGQPVSSGTSKSCTATNLLAQ